MSILATLTAPLVGGFWRRWLGSGIIPPSVRGIKLAVCALWAATVLYYGSSALTPLHIMDFVIPGWGMALLFGVLFMLNWVRGHKWDFQDKMGLRYGPFPVLVAVALAVYTQSPEALLFAFGGFGVMFSYWGIQVWNKPDSWFECRKFPRWFDGRWAWAETLAGAQYFLFWALAVALI